MKDDWITEGDAVARYAGRSSAGEAKDPVEPHGSLGVRRQASGLSLMIDLRRRTGERQAFPYSHLVDVRTETSTRIELRFTTARVTIEGARLSSLYDRLVEQRVAWVREADRYEAFSDEPAEEPLVERILIEQD